MIEGNAGFAYKRAFRYATMNSGWPQIEDDDILQAALMGLVEAVDRFDPTKGFAFTTYANFWIVKRIGEEINNTHWNTMRPPRKEMRSFMYKKMDGDSAGDYVRKYMSKSDGAGMDSSSIENQYQWADIEMAVASAQLDIHEKRVFDTLYGDNPDSDQLSDLTRGEIGDLEFSMLQKIKDQL